MTRSALLLIALAAVGTGCASRFSAPPAGAQGTVDIARLVKFDPAYRTVADYDRAIAGLDRSLAPVAQPPSGGGAITLPALSLPAAASRPVGITGLRSRLEQSRSRQLDNLVSVRADARRRQIRREAGEIAKTAQSDYLTRVAEIEQTYRASMQQVVAAQEVRRVNLEIQIKALKTTLTHYPDPSKTTEPAAEASMPRLAASRVALAEKTSELAMIDTDLKSRLAAVDSKRDEQLGLASSDRAHQIDVALAVREQELALKDEEQIAREGSELDRQIQVLVAQATELASNSGAPTGTEGQVTIMARGLPPPAKAQKAAALGTLERERTRWIAYLSDEARSAALDAARQKQWKISFGPALSGSKDLTGAVAGELRATSWRS